MPGVVQTHVHLVQTLFRGLAEDMPLLQWLRTRVWPLEAALDEASLRASVRLGLLDLLLTGTTTILDMGTTKHGDIVAEELVRSGMRARFGQTMMDTGEGVPPGLLETTRASLDASGALVKRWHTAASGRIGLGADGAACNNQLDGFEEMRMATLLARVVSGIGSLTASDAMALATREGAKMLKIDAEVGSLEQGKRADLVVLDVNRLDGPGGDPAARILFGGGSRAIRHVLVDGEFLVRDGVPTKMDPNEVRAKAAEQLQPLLKRAGLA